MRNIFQFLALILISRIVASLNVPLTNNTDCDCQVLDIDNYNKQCSFKMQLPFDIKFIPSSWVEIICWDEKVWSNFNCNVSSKIKNIKKLVLKYCDVERSTNLSKIAKLTGAENVEFLHFHQSFLKDFDLSKEHFQAFANVKDLTIQFNRRLNFDGDALEYLSNLINIQLLENSLTAIPEKLFQNSLQLQSIRLQHNSIEQFKSGTFQKLFKLKELILHHNKISKIELHTFDDLSSLLRLKLSRNLLTSLTNDVFRNLTNLEKLELNHNSLSSLPANLLQNNIKLNEILLGQNPLETLPSELFRNLKNLKNLQIENCGFKSLPEDLFQGLSNLEILDISKNKLAHLPDNIFHDLQNLKSLRLFNNNLMKISSVFLKDLISVEAVELDFNQIQIIESGAFENLKKLNTLNLSHNKLSQFNNSWSISSSVEVLELQNNEITTWTFDELNHLINSSLKRIKLNDEPLIEIVKV